MESKRSGVFSPCVSMDSSSMIKCLQALLSNYPSIHFNSVTTDKKNNGFKIFFSGPEHSVVLRKNLLSSEDQPVWIYPHTAYLVIRDVDHKKSPLFERDLRDAISKKFGSVIGVLKTSTSDRTRDWRLEIDIPEFKGLEVFQSKKDTFSNMTLPIPSRNETVTLRFWCRQCEHVGHFQHECLARSEESTVETEMKAEDYNSNVEQSEDNSAEQTSSSPDRNSEITPKRVSNFPLEGTERFAEKIGEEEVMSNHVQDNTTANTNRSRSNNLLTENDIKKETPESEKVIGAQGGVNPGNNNSGKNTDLKELIRGSTGLFKKIQGISSDDDDDIEVIGYTNNSSSNKSPLTASNGGGGGRNIEEESRSSPESKDTGFPFFSLPGIPGPSHGSSSASSAALKTPRGAEVTTALSERLQDCINEVCETAGVLDRKKLDAFLIHVKKKSNPIRVALNYTANTKGLKDQLKGILHMYYNTPQTGTKEDIQFIKWLNGLVERYDGSIPKKRKRSGKNDDEPSSKR